MDIEEKVQYWLDLTDYDLSAAKSLLKSKHYLYVGFMCHQVIEKSLKAPEIYLIGENYDVQNSCGCENPSHYVLYIRYGLSKEYPIICGDCEKSIPLYKFPKTYTDDEEYHDILCWQRLYSACDTQFMLGIGERHGYKMMNDLNSELSKEGLRICAFLEEKVNKPFYYFLFKY